ncbi:MAG: hypothetical protein LBS25_08635 [Candidatus Symbiothrix sp.]|jgi:hypothetical protein|nr:hypothetical protein [Candidatus Symbiothrix sp.]
MKKTDCPISKITPDDGYQYFFGYYDRCPWNKAEDKILAHRISFLDHFPENETAEVGYIDLLTNTFVKIDATSAWNWQQGSQLQWITHDGKEKIIYNQRINNTIKGCMVDADTLEKTIIDSSIYTVSRDGTKILTLNYGRLYDTKIDYGIFGIIDTNKNVNTPDNDGIFLYDLTTQTYKLIVSIKTLSETSKVYIGDKKQYVNHLMFNPSSNRFCFLHRYERNDRITQSRLFTSDLEGKDIRLLFEGMISHYDWKDNETILAWAGKRKLIGNGTPKKFSLTTALNKTLKPIYYFLGKPRILMQKIMRDSFYLIKDMESANNSERIGFGIMYCDGHCTYSLNKKWILTDGYPDLDNKQPLFLFNTANNDFVETGRFYTPKKLDKEIRVDLHPRSNHEGNKILIDSAMNGSRSMYIIDVSEITK